MVRPSGEARRGWRPPNHGPAVLWERPDPNIWYCRTGPTTSTALGTWVVDPRVRHRTRVVNRDGLCCPSSPFTQANGGEGGAGAPDLSESWWSVLSQDSVYLG